MINFEAETDKFPREDNFWLGHTLVCQNGQLIRMSWRDAISVFFFNNGNCL